MAPKRHLHILTPETCECYLIWCQYWAFADVIKALEKKGVAWDMQRGPNVQPHVPLQGWRARDAADQDTQRKAGSGATPEAETGGITPSREP